MAALDLGRVSTNWKKLQEKLRSDQKEANASGGKALKRKRAPDEKARGSISANGVKRFKVGLSASDRRRYKGTMGGSISTPSTEKPAAQKISELIHDHDIDPAAISEAYGTAAATARVGEQDDCVNGGLHPTHKAGRYVALDCEMVGTGPPPHSDNVLARVSLVNFYGEQIYDSYVQAPDRVRVEDYRTHVSGIRAQHMRAGFARPFLEVQRDVARLLDGKTLVGHALKNDLSTLLLSHPKRDIRDTSRHARFRVESRGKPPALRNLARSLLGMEIQTGEHSSVEDARAAMLLFRHDKAGFEAEHRKQFGRSRRSATTQQQAKGAVSRSGDVAAGDFDAEDGGGEDDEDSEVSGEEGSVEDEDETAEAKRASHSATKKRKTKKKKKRTKRK